MINIESIRNLYKKAKQNNVLNSYKIKNKNLLYLNLSIFKNRDIFEFDINNFKILNTINSRFNYMDDKENLIAINYIENQCYFV